MEVRVDYSNEYDDREVCAQIANEQTDARSGVVFDRLVELSVSWYLEERLPRGEDVELGLTEDAVAIVGISPEVPEDIRRKVAQEAARLRAEEAAEKRQRR